MRTINQLVSGLILCASGHCDHMCPYHGENNCEDLLMLDAADSIIRLFRDKKDLTGDLEKQKLSSVYEEVHNAEQTDKV